MVKNRLKSFFDRINQKYKIRLGGILILFALIVVVAALISLASASQKKINEQVQASMDLYGFNRELDVFFTDLQIQLVNPPKGKPYSVIVQSTSGIYENKPVNVLLYDKNGDPHDIIITPFDVDPDKSIDNPFIKLIVSKEVITGELQDFIDNNYVSIDLHVHPETFKMLYP